MDMMLWTGQQSACVGWGYIHERRGTVDDDGVVDDDATDDEHTTAEENT